MIYLKQNTINTDVVLTLQPTSTLFIYSAIQPYYLFEFSSPMTNSTIRFVAPDTAPVSARTSYDQFTIITTGSSYVNYTAGTISLAPGTFWEYNIYEQVGQYNLDLSGTTSMIKSGKVLYSGTTSQVNYISATGRTSFITA